MMNETQDGVINCANDLTFGLHEENHLSLHGISFF